MGDVQTPNLRVRIGVQTNARGVEWREGKGLRAREVMGRRNMLGLGLRNDMFDDDRTC